MNRESSKCKEIDQTLMFKQLPAHMIVKNFIKGEEDCNYEIYLRDYLNNSSFFMSKSSGQKYQACPTESHGEPDARSDDYAVDFKLMISNSKMEANSIFSGSITKYGEGAYGFGSAKVKGEQPCTQLCQALRYKEVNDLENIDNINEDPLIKKDIKKYLRILHTKKNILLFLPYEFSYSEEHTDQGGIDGILQALRFDLKASIEYREKNAKGYHTYAATLFNGKVLFFRLSTNAFEYVDSVDMTKSKTFMNLYDCGRFN